MIRALLHLAVAALHSGLGDGDRPQVTRNGSLARRKRRSLPTHTIPTSASMPDPLKAHRESFESIDGSLRDQWCGETRCAWRASSHRASRGVPRVIRPVSSDRGHILYGQLEKASQFSRCSSRRSRATQPFASSSPISALATTEPTESPNRDDSRKQCEGALTGPVSGSDAARALAQNPAKKRAFRHQRAPRTGSLRNRGLHGGVPSRGRTRLWGEFPDQQGKYGGRPDESSDTWFCRLDPPS